jgi:hypothetical protein
MVKKSANLTRPTPARQDAPRRGLSRNERRGEAYSGPYVEPLSDVRTKLAGLFTILLEHAFDRATRRRIQFSGNATGLVG